MASRKPGQCRTFLRLLLVPVRVQNPGKVVDREGATVLDLARVDTCR